MYWGVVGVFGGDFRQKYAIDWGRPFPIGKVTGESSARRHGSIHPRSALPPVLFMVLASRHDLGASRPGRRRLLSEFLKSEVGISQINMSAAHYYELAKQKQWLAPDADWHVGSEADDELSVPIHVDFESDDKWPWHAYWRESDNGARGAWLTHEQLEADMRLMLPGDGLTLIWPDAVKAEGVEDALAHNLQLEQRMSRPATEVIVVGHGSDGDTVVVPAQDTIGSWEPQEVETEAQTLL